MKSYSKSAVLASVAAAVAATAWSVSAAADAKPGVDWPQFRGIRATGVSEGFTLPTSWDVARNQGVAWKTAIPGLGLSSPIVWGDLACVTTSISGMKDAGLKVGLYGDVKPVNDDTEHEWRIYCLDKKSGAVRWQQSVLKAVPKIKRHTKASHANSTLATDGQRLIAFFGSEGLYAYDLKGKLLWKKDLGVLDAGWFTDPSAQWEFTTTSSSSRPTFRRGRFSVRSTPARARNCGGRREPRCRRGVRRRSMRSRDRRSSS
jgi:outer membrane protein assembly factor BamB